MAGTPPRVTWAVHCVSPGEATFATMLVVKSVEGEGAARAALSRSSRSLSMLSRWRSMVGDHAMEFELASVPSVACIDI